VEPLHDVEIPAEIPMGETAIKLADVNVGHEG
jgi:hypothetical protein